MVIKSNRLDSLKSLTFVLSVRFDAKIIHSVVFAMLLRKELEDFLLRVSVERFCASARKAHGNNAFCDVGQI